MKSDIEIAQEADLKPIEEIANKVGLGRDELELYGDYKAKLTQEALDEIWGPDEPSRGTGHAHDLHRQRPPRNGEPYGVCHYQGDADHQHESRKEVEPRERGNGPGQV